MKKQIVMIGLIVFIGGFTCSVKSTDFNKDGLNVTRATEGEAKAMNSVVVVYHSGGGQTKKVAKKIVEGIKKENVLVDLLTTEQALNQMDFLDKATTIVFGSPTYMSAPSADFKKFADATSGRWMKGLWKDKLAAGFTNSGGLCGGKLLTLLYFATLASQHGMVWISLGQPVFLTTEGHGATPNSINRLNGSVGLMTQSDNAPVEKTPAPGDLESADLFGKRIAQMTKKWRI
jgi:NAD(P)H dehydrogenase (quinone)